MDPELSLRGHSHLWCLGRGDRRIGRSLPRLEEGLYDVFVHRWGEGEGKRDPNGNHQPREREESCGETEQLQSGARSREHGLRETRAGRSRSGGVPSELVMGGRFVRIVDMAVCDPCAPASCVPPAASAKGTQYSLPMRGTFISRGF